MSYRRKLLALNGTSRGGQIPVPTRAEDSEGTMSTTGSHHRASQAAAHGPHAALGWSSQEGGG